MSESNELITQSDKQKAMASAWQENKAQKKTAIDQAKTVYKAAKQKAEADKKTALEERKKALHEAPQDPAKVQAASTKVEQANQAIAQAKTVKNAAVQEAKANYNTRHDELRAAEKAHNNDSWDKPFNQNMTLKEMRAEEDSILHETGDAGTGEANTGEASTDNAVTDNAGTDNANDPSSSESGSEGTTESDGTDNAQGGSMKGTIKNAYNETKNDLKGKNQGLRFSDSFYRDVGAMVRGQRTGNLYDAESETAKEQAQNYRNRAATNQMEAQRSQQIANQNPYAEAGKMASVQNDAENRQNVQKAGVLGAGAALARKTNTPDVQSQMAREDQQQNVANQRRDEANTAQEESTAKEGDVKNYQIKSRDHDTDRNEASDLSLGKDTTAQAEPETIQAGEDEEQTTEEQTTEEQANDQPEQTEQTPDPEPPQEEEPPKPEAAGTSWQNVMNYLTYGNDTTSGWNKGTKPGFNEAKQYAESQGWKPIQASQAEFDGDLSHLQELVKAQQPDFYNAWSSGSGRVGADGSQINRGDIGDEVIDKAQTPSDARIKDIHTCLSDLRMKYIKEDFDKYGRCSPDDFMWLLSKAGKLKHNEREYDALGTEDFSSDSTVLEAYRDHIKNYVYNYKPEAVNVDPRIDPNEEHIGPMAQDIEQVNPACVKETSDGVKTVDTARLAMMNAGAIGDLARQLDELNKKFQALGL